MEQIKIMVNGIPGNMAGIAARHVIKDDRFDLIPFSLTGPEIEETEYSIDGFNIQLIHPSNRDVKIEEIKQDLDLFITVDYTHPSAVNDNAQFYCKTGLPFVMGTTGGERDKLPGIVQSSSISAVIAVYMFRVPLDPKVICTRADSWQPAAK